MLSQLLLLSQRLLKEYNRPYQRYFLHKHNLSHRGSIIVGARGIGKSTVMVQFLLEKHPETSDKILFIHADHFLVRRKSLYEIAEAFYLNGGEIICFDEIHKYPQWSMELKSIYDTFPKLTFIASGSSILEVHKGSHDLSRRAIVYDMVGMSLREFIEFTHGISLPTLSLSDIMTNHGEIAVDILKKIATSGQQILPLFNQYIQYGYYPYFKEFSDRILFYRTLEQNIHNTLERDLPAVYPNLTGAAIRKIEKLLSFIATSVPFVPDLKKLRQITEVGDERTLKTYLKYLEDAGIILQLQKFGKKLSTLAKPEKIFFRNTSLPFAIEASEKINNGSLRETFFASMLTGTQHSLAAPAIGDFLVDEQYIFEVGGKNKDANQIKDTPNAYLALDDIENGYGNRIPLWLFGFLY